MESFKVSVKELIILILLSAPIGIFIYLNNYNKIVYEIRAKRGFVVIENLCESYGFDKIYLQKELDIDFLNQNFENIDSSLDSKFNGQIKVSIRNEGSYEIRFKGKAGEETKMAERSHQILEYITNSELSNFNKLYKSLKLHCKSGDFTVFKMVPMENIINQYPSKKSYSKLHLGFLLVLPSVIIYLLWIAVRYIRKIKIKSNI